MRTAGDLLQEGEVADALRVQPARGRGLEIPDGDQWWSSRGAEGRGGCAQIDLRRRQEELGRPAVSPEGRPAGEPELTARGLTPCRSRRRRTQSFPSNQKMWLAICWKRASLRSQRRSPSSRTGRSSPRSERSETSTNTLASWTTSRQYAVPWALR